MTVSTDNASRNNFVIFHTFVKKHRQDTAKKLCDRNTGVGAGGLIVLNGQTSSDFEWEF